MGQLCPFNHIPVILTLEIGTFENVLALSKIRGLGC